MRIFHPPAVLEHLLGLAIAAISVFSIGLGLLLGAGDLPRCLHLKRL
jgi:hypothetical protein